MPEPVPDPSVLTSLNWYWMGIGLTVPLLLALLVALPFWRTRQMTFGSIVGTTVIFVSGVGLIFREYVELDRIVRSCLDQGFVCWPVPSVFTRCAIYAFIALGEIFVLFTVGLLVGERVRRRDYSPEWR